MSSVGTPTPNRTTSTSLPHGARLRRVAALKQGLDVHLIAERLRTIRQAGGDPSTYLDFLERKLRDEERRLNLRHRPLWRRRRCR